MISSGRGGSAGNRIPLFRGARPLRYPGVVAGERRRPAASNNVDPDISSSSRSDETSGQSGRPASDPPALSQPRVRFELEADVHGFKRLMAPMVQKTMNREVGQLARLKDVLEAR
jgi:hypothetical protein